MKSMKLISGSFATAKFQAKISIGLLILILTVIGFSMAACGDSAPATYNATVVGGIGSGTYEQGAIVYIMAITPSGYLFTNWTVNFGGIILTNANSPSTTFIMPANAVTVTANFIVEISGINPDTGSGTATGNLADRRYRVEVYNTNSATNEYLNRTLSDFIRSDVISRGHTAANTYTNQTFSDVLSKWNSTAFTGEQITEGTTRLTSSLQINNSSQRAIWFFQGSNYRFFYVNRTATNPNYYTVEVYNTNSATDTYLTNTYSGKTIFDIDKTVLISRGHTATTYTNQTFSDVLSKWSSAAFTSGQITEGSNYLTRDLQTNNYIGSYLLYFQNSNYRVFLVKQE